MTQQSTSQENKLWISLLKDLRTALLDYRVQKEKDSLRVDHKELIELTSTRNVLKFSKIKEILVSFVSDVDAGLDTQYTPSLRSLTLDHMKVGLLNDLLNSMLSDHTFERPSKKELLVKGWVVTTSSINQYIKKNPGALDKIEDVKIFALEKVFIDEDLDFSGLRIQLTIIAPTWEVTEGDEEGRRTVKIMLDGKQGAEHEKDAGNLDVPGSDGNDGKPGLRGGAAGAILGIGQACESCGSLKVSANGGRGGPGQDGGAGQKGKDGREASIPTTAAALWDCRVMIEDWKREGSNPLCSLHKGLIKVGLWTSKYAKHCEVDGGGKPGGNGGNGGPGGIGGNGGRASLFLQKNPELSSEIISNARGKSGDPGKGGKGGSGATRRIWKVTMTGFCESMVDCECMIMNDDERKTEPYPPSKDGKNGLSQEFEGGKSTAGANYFNNPSLAINEYKNYLRDNMNNNQLMAPILRNFINYLEQDKKITGLYDTVGLIKDLLGLEIQPGQAMQNSLRKQSYQLLLERVEKYELQPHELKDADDFRLVLSYLYTAISSRIHDIDNDANKDLVVDVRKNLAYMEGNIEEWRNFKDLVEKNKVRNKYKEGIQNKIEEANAFIENEITKDIENNIQKTTDQLNNLYAETVKLQHAAEEEKKKLIKRKEQLERQLVLRSILGVVQIASQALAFIGPVGAAAGAVIGGVTSVVEGLATSDDPSANVAVSALPGAISTTLTKLNNAYKEKQETFKKQLHNANAKMEAFLNDKDVKADASAAKKKVLQIQGDIAVTKSKLDELVKRSNIEDPASISEMYDLRKKIDSLLKEGKTEIGKLGGADKYKNVVDKVQNIVGLAKMGVDLYSKVQGDLDKIDGVDKSIAAVNAKMGKLDAYEESIYTKIGPMIGRIKTSLESAENSEGKSHAALDVTKWQVQGSIRDVRKEMQEITKGFEAGNEITYYIDKVEYAMSMMIQMFDRIQSYSEQGALVDVITDVNSAADILNAELYSAVSELKLKISSNILSEYTNTMNAVKQYVFPFAIEYMKPLTVPDRFNLNKTDQLVYNLKTLQKTLQREESTTLTRESNIMADVLFGEGESHPPFFIWKNKNDIKKLLEGRSVMLNADINNSKIQENAVKFNDIGIRFKSDDQNVQERLNRVLTRYIVRMKHLGESYYRCKSDVYKVAHQKQTIRHAAIKNENGYYSDGNVIYAKITHNEPVLSPFAWWSITLESEDNNATPLKEFSDSDIYLELEGRGNFVKRYGISCNPDLSQYYTLYRTIGQRRKANDLGDFKELFEKLEDYKMSAASESEEFRVPAEENNGAEELGHNDTTVGISGENVNSFPAEFQDSSHYQQISVLPGKESTNLDSSPMNLLGVPANLPLFELMIRKINGTKRTRRSMGSGQQDADSEYAQNLAYSAYYMLPSDRAEYVPTV